MLKESRKSMSWGVLVLVAASLGVTATASAAPAQVFKDPFRQSPVRGAPGDLLLIAGNGFAAGDRVAYQKLTDTNSVPAPPTTIPSPNTATSGECAVVLGAGGAPLNAPDSLTVRLPAEMIAGQSYVLWVRNAAGEWSAPLRINDARPLWVSPDRVRARQDVAGLQRALKVVGRNLAPAPGTPATQVRLVKGSTTLTLTAANDGNPATALEDYVAQVTLPSSLATGNWTVKVSRDGTSWVTLAGQTLSVVLDMTAPKTYSVANYGCRPNDGVDDTSCVRSAITAATNKGGTVSFGSGTWDLGTSASPAPDKTYGHLVPAKVNLAGAGAGSTIVRRGPLWDAEPLFTLLGANSVSGIRFSDPAAHSFPPGTTPARTRTFLLIGRWSSSSSWGDPTVIDSITITRNVFDNPVVAIREGGFPIRRLYVTFNEFGGWYNGMFLAGPYYNEWNRAQFDLQDSIVASNTFKPGGYLDATIGQGTIASELGATRRVDWSANTVDGHATDYLYGAAPGFRAGHFFHMSNNHEMLLVSKNSYSCTGDKAGDGEAIAYDNNANQMAFATPLVVRSATSTTVGVDGTLLVPSPTNYYKDHWVQVVGGAGVGQVRKVTSYSVSGGRVTFTVSPAWDVVPQVGSARVTVAREFWQVYTVDNQVDSTACAVGPSSPDWWWRPEQGEIACWAMTADSVIEGNVQTRSDGIVLHTTCGVPPDVPSQSFVYFTDVRGNLVDDEYNHDAYCSMSGIELYYGASDGSASPVLAYGVDISHNTVRHADGLRGGAIVIANSWWGGGPGNASVVQALVHDNAIEDLDDPPPDPASNAGPNGACDLQFPRRSGIHVHEWPHYVGNPPALVPPYLVSRTVLSANAFEEGLACKIVDEGSETVILDPAPPGGWCSCLPATVQTCADLPVPIGGSCTCTTSTLGEACVSCAGAVGTEAATECRVCGPCPGPGCDLGGCTTRTSYACP